MAVNRGRTGQMATEFHGSAAQLTRNRGREGRKYGYDAPGREVDVGIDSGVSSIGWSVGARTCGFRRARS